MKQHKQISCPRAEERGEPCRSCRACGTNPRARGTNPRSRGTNPKAEGTNLKAQDPNTLHMQILQARFRSVCPRCMATIQQGNPIILMRGGKYIHAQCWYTGGSAVRFVWGN